MLGDIGIGADVGGEERDQEAALDDGDLAAADGGGGRGRDLEGAVREMGGGCSSGSCEDAGEGKEGGG